jgi:hypothetical protein
MLNININKRKIILTWGIGLPTRYSLRYGVEVDGLMTNAQTISSNTYELENTITVDNLDPQTKYMLDGALFNEQGDIVETLSRSIETYANIDITNFEKSADDSSGSIKFTTSVPTTMEVRADGINIVVYKTESYVTNYDFSIGSLKDARTYNFTLKLLNDSGGYIERSVVIDTRPGLYNPNLITPAYQHIINAMMSNGAKNFLLSWSNILKTTPLTDFIGTAELLTSDQLIMFNQSILGMFIDSGSNIDLFVRRLNIWLNYDNIDPSLTRKQKKAILLSTKTIADTAGVNGYKKIIVENIEKMNSFGLISNGSSLLAAYTELTGNTLQLNSIDYTNELT